MSYIDVSGPIYEGMWSYGHPFPDFKLKDIKEPEWVKGFSPKSQEFKGLCMVTGTYIDGPSHALGLGKSYPMHEIAIENLFGVDAYVLKFDLNKLDKEKNRPFISLDDIKKAEKSNIQPGAIWVFATGWGAQWTKKDFLENAWFFKKDALEYIVSKKPFIIAGDTPYFDNLENEQGNWKLIYKNNILILAPLVNIEKIKGFKIKIFISPLKVLNTTGLPCRVIVEDV